MSEDRILTDREVITNEPPDILLTNYKMLDYLLMRPDHARLWRYNSLETLRFLVVDEIHTFDGAQGTDLACLIRRLKQRLATPTEYLCCVGTSATLGGEQAGAELVRYASQVFGETFEPDAIVSEERVSRSEFLQGRQMAEFYQHPSARQLRELAPGVHDDERGYVEAAIGAWFDQPLVIDEAGAWRVRLGELLGEHLFLARLLSQLEGHVLEMGDLIEGLSSAHPSYRKYDARDMEVLITSFLALISVARSPVAETASQRAEREGARHASRGAALLAGPDPAVAARASTHGGERGPRALARLLRRSDGNPASSPPARRLTCPSCALMGWASLIKQEQRDISCILKDFYAAFFRGDPRVEFFFPHDALDEGVPTEVSLAHLTIERLEGTVREGHMVVRRVSAIKGSSGNKRLSRDCPRCGAHEALTLVGFRAATLTSTYINQMIASRFNDHKKLLTFSDSVQDAAHRAGFFGARTRKFTVRAGVQQALQALPSLPTLDVLADHVVDHWQGCLGRG